MCSKRDIYNILQRFWSETSGQFGMFFALLALPVLLCVGYALDYTYATREKVKIKSAVDAAVLAAKINDVLTPQEQAEFAKSYFDSNYLGDVDVTLDARADADQVELIASGTIQQTIGSALGLSDMTVSTKSIAENATENVICVLALGERGHGVLFAGKVQFLAPSCTVHSNSILQSQSSFPAVAKSFCASGKTSGDFQPYAKGECQKIEDPYAQTPPPLIQSCSAIAGLQGASSNMGGLIGTTGSITSAIPIIGDNVVLTPGTYCGGVEITGRNVTFLPGDYVMLDGPLIVEDGAQANATNVTIAFSGSKANLQIKDGSDFTIKAPKTGPRAGLAFMEIRELNGKTKTNGKNFIRVSSSLSVTGTLYFPTQAIEIKGGQNKVGAEAPATSFIAYSLQMIGDNGATVSVSVDHVAADIPPLLPRAADGVRLKK